MFDDFHILVPEVEGRLLSGFVEGECHLGIAEGNGRVLGAPAALCRRRAG